MAELQPCYVPEATREAFNLPSDGWYALDKDGEIIRELGCHSSIIGIEQARPVTVYHRATLEVRTLCGVN